MVMGQRLSLLCFVVQTTLLYWLDVLQPQVEECSPDDLLDEGGGTLEAPHLQFPLLKADFRAVLLFPTCR